MRNLKRILGAVLLLAANHAVAVDDVVTVTFDHPEHFTDLKPVNGSEKQFREVTLRQLEAYIKKEAGRWLPAEESLEITVKDIDLAGQVWPGSPYDQRLVKDVDYPVIRLHYRRLKDGVVIAEGDEVLKDMDFLRRPVRSRVGDGLRFEKRLLHDWLRKLFKGDTQVAAK
jgi:hypothetical protein